MLHIDAATVATPHIVFATIPSTCSAADARDCGLRATWVRRCCAGIAAKDPSISAEDLLDLAITMWDRPGCQTACPRLAVDLLFADQLASLH
ncbi:MAG: hypothetical protein ABI702_07965 [Burkholderiales bacterium]